MTVQWSSRGFYNSDTGAVEFIRFYNSDTLGQLVPNLIWALSSLPHHFPSKDDLRSITTQPRLSN